MAPGDKNRRKSEKSQEGSERSESKEELGLWKEMKESRRAVTH